MPISAPDLADLIKSTLDLYLKNTPTDQIGVEHPFYTKLLAGRKPFGGARQNISGSIRTAYGSNFAWTFGENAVSFTKRNTAQTIAYPWKVAVDGMYIPWDTLFANGIKVEGDVKGSQKLQDAERVQLFNLMAENTESFDLGFKEKLDIELHRSGASSADAVGGLDSLVSLTPTTGTVGGLDRATFTMWRNYVKTGISTATKGNISSEMELAFRRCVRNGGKPNLIMVGSAFLDAYRNDLAIVQNANAGSIKTIDGGTNAHLGNSVSESGLYFKNIPIIWDPTFEMLDTLDAPVTAWEKRCYMINTKHMVLRDDGVEVSSPVRPHTVRANYTMVQNRMALYSDRLNAHAVLAIA